MNLESILKKFRSVQHNGNGWEALCPAHADKSPSLSVRDKNGRVLLHCFAGCTVEAICAAVGVEIRDLFSEPCASRKPEPRVVRDAQKQLAGLRSRLTPADRERPVTVVYANREGLDFAIARALALAVEGELVQVAFAGGAE